LGFKLAGDLLDQFGNDGGLFACGEVSGNEDAYPSVYHIRLRGSLTPLAADYING
jgi:hypothetical protein